MPIYEYVCQSCGAEVEVLHGLNAPGPAACDVCGGPMRKRLAPPAILFRGSGWAKKERREAASARAAPDKKAKTDGSAATDGGASGGPSEAPATSDSAGTDRKAGGGSNPSRGQAKDTSTG